jgi:3-oxoacyl-[acyl-carrier protein] reductase
MMFELIGKTALVTGAGSGIGAAIAETFARARARVFVTDINGATAEATASRITGAWHRRGAGRDDERRARCATSAGKPAGIW